MIMQFGAKTPTSAKQAYKDFYTTIHSTVLNTTPVQPSSQMRLGTRMPRSNKQSHVENHTTALCEIDHVNHSI